MNRVLAMLGGLGAGAAIMYFMDPDRGARRRALIRDKATGMSNDLQDAMGKRSRDLTNRAQGMLHEAKSKLSGGSGQTNMSAEREGMGI